MRNANTLAALLVAATFTVQTPLSAQTTFGVLAGGNAATLAGVDVSGSDIFSNSTSIKRNMGFQAGLYLNKRLTSVWSLQPELHYVQKGAQLEAGTGAGLGSLVFKLGYGEIPLLLRADFGSGSWRPFVTVGPTFAMRTSCKAEAETEEIKLSVDCNEFEGEGGTAEDPFTKTDVGGSAGVGLAGSMLGRSAFVQIRYGRGFTNVVTDAANAGSDEKPKNSVISLILGIGR